MAVINGTAGADTLTGTASDDQIFGLDGNDVLIGGAGADQLDGGAGTDYASYANGAAVTVNLKTGIHTGDAAGDTYTSIEGIIGSSLNDTFVSGAEAIQLYGGNGTDTVDYSTSAAAVTINLTAGTGIGGDAQGDTYNSIEKVIGSAFADALSSSSIGHILEGGGGNDVYIVGSQNIFVSEAAGGGDDEIRTALTSFSMANYANVERLTYTGTAGATLTGNASDNLITGGTGNDVLVGGAGADQLIGGAGTDYASYSTSTSVTLNFKTGVHTGDAAGDSFSGIEGYIGSGGNDTFISGTEAALLNGGAGTDTVDYSTSAAAVTVNLTAGTGVGGDAQGDTYSNMERVIGTALADTLSSATGGHVLEGGAGDDVYVVGNQSVVVTETAGGGDDEIRTALTTYSMDSFANVERLTYTGTANATLTGNAGANIITGGTGSDVLIGGAGADQLIGGAGTDYASYVNGAAVTLNFKTGVHIGDAAGDSFSSIEGFIGSNGNDTFVSGSEAIQLYGENGTDAVDYSTSAAAVTVNLAAGTGVGGDAQGDTYNSIEKVIGSAFADTLSSATGGHVLEGGAGNDIYVVSNQGVVITETASGGDDEIRTALTAYSMDTFANVERLTFTGTGNATLTGNAGANIITGGTGNDILIGGAGADQLVGGAGTDYASYANGAAVTLNFKTGVHSGDAAGDSFSGIEGYVGSGGNDTFVSGSEAALLNGGAGTDTVDYSTSAAAVTVNLSGGTGSGGDAQGDSYANIERVIGSALADTLTSSTTGHALEGGAGNDVYVIGNQGVNVIEAAGGGDDEIRTALTTFYMDTYANVERLTFTATGNATLFGNAGDNVIIGGAGDDRLVGGAGADQLIGGAGTDTVSYQTSVGVTLDFRTGIHTGDAAGDSFSGIEVISGSSWSDTFVSGAEALRFDGAGGFDTIDYSASAAAVTVNLPSGTGSGGDAQGDTYANIEKVIGSAFADTLSSSTSANTLEGGAGNDVYIVGNQGVIITEAAGGGDDEIRTALSAFYMDTYANVERLTFTGTGNATLFGNAGDNVITGGAGDDILQGLAGADQLVGGAGYDWASYQNSAGVTLDFRTGVHTGDAAGDTFSSIEAITGSSWNDIFVSGADAFRFNGGAGFDTVDYSASAAAITVDLSSGSGSGGDAQGDSYVNMERVVGSAFADTLSSSTSGHMLEGGAGDDIYIVGNQGVTVTEAASGGTDEIRTALATFSMAAYANVENLTYTGTSAATLTGNASDNVITGGAGNDWLQGGAGADQFIGGAGTDWVSYADSTAAIIFDLATGAFSGIGAGDTFTGIEKFSGTNFGDKIIASTNADSFDGAAGFDAVSYASATLGVGINLTTLVNSGWASGDVFSRVEIFEGTAFADSFVGDIDNNIFIGGAGADTFDGSYGADSVWYLTSSAAVTVNLATATASGGDATGDTFANIENLMGSNFDDTLTGTASGSRIEGAEGNDIIYGGAGSDTIYGGFGTITEAFNTNNTGNQADIIYAGDGNDFIFSAGNYENVGQGQPLDVGTEIYAGAGNDTVRANQATVDGGTGNDMITISRGVAYGGDGDDQLIGDLSGYSLLGGNGSDTLSFNFFGGNGDGQDGGDDYVINTENMSYIRDSGATGTDYVRLNIVNDVNDFAYSRSGNDLIVSNAADAVV